MLYEFFCNKCNYVWEIETEYGKELKKPNKCKNCKSKDIGQQYTTNIVCNFIEANVMTAEKASEINKKRLGKEQLDLMADADPVISKRKLREKTKKELPFTPVDIKKIKNVKKFIDEGTDV